jgi:hypothetical protein
MRRLWNPFVIAVCLAASSLPAQTPPAAAPGPKNLQVLPSDISRDQLIETMKAFSRGLGVRCNHCHVVTATEPKEQFDFAADDKETKKIARVMIQMVKEINGTWMTRVGEAAGGEETTERPQLVGCWTCHRGKTEPEEPPPAPAPQQREMGKKE